MACSKLILSALDSLRVISIGELTITLRVVEMNVGFSHSNLSRGLLNHVSIMSETLSITGQRWLPQDSISLVLKPIVVNVDEDIITNGSLVRSLTELILDQGILIGSLGIMSLVCLLLNRQRFASEPSLTWL